MNLKEWNKDEGLPNVSSLGTGFNELQEGGAEPPTDTGYWYTIFRICGVVGVPRSATLATGLSIEPRRPGTLP